MIGTLRYAVLITLAAMAAYSASRVEMSTDITNFMPDEESSRLAAVSRQLTESELLQMMVLTIEAPSTETAVSAARALAEKLRAHPEVAWLRSGAEEGMVEDVYRLYFPRRYYFLSDEPAERIPEMLAAPALRRRAEELRQELAQPTSSLLKRVIPADPLGGFSAILDRLRTHRPALRSVDGQLVTPDGRFAVILLRTHASAFASEPQRILLRDIHDAFTDIAARYDGPLRLEQSGANRFAVQAEDSIRADLRLIAICSFGGVTALFLLFFRSLRTLVLSSLPPLGGMLVATTLGLLVFGRLDGLTIAFGMSLIGVAIDYPIHLLNHHGIEARHASPREIVRRLRPSLVLGAVTTMASFAGLGLTSFPGFREIAFFAIVGVAAALAITLFVLPHLLVDARPAPPLSRAVAGSLGGTVRVLARHRRWLLPLPIACALAAPVVLPRLQWVDDLSQLAELDPEIAREERRVRERVSRFDGGRFVIGVAADSEQAITLNERIHERLEQARGRGAFADMRSLHALLWPEELQRQNWRVLTGQPAVADRVIAAFSDAGFRRDAFTPFRESLATEPPPPLRVSDLRQSPLADLLSPHLMSLGDHTAVVTYLRGIHSADAIRAALAGLDDVYLLEQRAFMNEIYAEFRATTLRQIVVGGLLVVAVLLLRYRRVRPAIAAFLPSLLVAVVVLEVFAACEIETNLLHLVSLIMVMGMGVDYGIFMVDSRHHESLLGATMLSLLLSCLTTMFVFGALAISSHPALRAIGLTSGLGIVLSLLFAPLALIVTGTDTDGGKRRKSEVRSQKSQAAVAGVSSSVFCLLSSSRRPREESPT